MNPFLTSISNGGNLLSNNASTSTPTTEMIKDVSILSPLLSGQVLAYSGAVWQNIVPQSLVNDTMGSLLDVNISSLQNAQYLSYSSTLQKWLNTNITESNVKNLVNDLAACEKVTNKNSINGYCGLINGFYKYC